MPPGQAKFLKAKIRTIMGEAALVAVIGTAVAFAANGLSPRGLALSRDYFPSGTNAVPATPARVPATITNEPSESDQLSARLRGKGLQEVKRSQAETLFHDPRDQDGRIIFVDARDEDHYQEGHVPRAYPLDPYHPEKEMSTVLPLCQAAEKVVVYCTGGDCEDGDTTAILLRDTGVSPGKIFVYGGGFEEWDANHLPVETGARNSGTMKGSK